ncbi:hypothetical protein C8F01DRAFT_1250621 [Mycena amicta]|nr:hypothetical protein C8F01DRAFT_1250621 [Mycena amicta]
MSLALLSSSLKTLHGTTLLAHLPPFLSSRGLSQPSVLKPYCDASTEVDEAKKSPEPLAKDFWTDIYYKGTEPLSMRGWEREAV